MTTKIERRFTSNVFEEGGEVFLASPKAEGARLSALSFIRGSVDDLRAARRQCLGDAMQVAIGATKAEESLRLLVTYRSEADSVRTRTSSPLRTFEKRGLRFTSAEWTEVLSATPDGVRWASEVAVEAGDVGTVESAMFENSTAILAAACPGPVIYGFLARGWRAEGDANTFLRETALAAMAQGLLVIRIFGAFDDREASADILGSPEAIERLKVNSPAPHGE